MGRVGIHELGTVLLLHTAIVSVWRSQTVSVPGVYNIEQYTIVKAVLVYSIIL